MSLLSVILPNYNHGHYIGEALQAILEQSFKSLEVIVIDDGSTDDSISVIQEFANKYSNVKLLQNKRNRGAVYSVEKGLQYASGDFVCFQSADDRVLPGFFEKSMNMLAQFPQAGLCCSNPANFEDRTNIINKNNLQWSDKPCYCTPEELAEKIHGGYVAGHTSIIRKSSFEEAGGLIPELKWHCDWFWLHVIAFRHGICYIPEPLSTIRLLSGSYSSSGRRDRAQQEQVLSELLRLLKSPEYRDVLPYFVRGNVMAHFGDEIVRLVMMNPEFWDMETMMLIQYPLWQRNLHLAQQTQNRIQKETDTANALYQSGKAAFDRGDLEAAKQFFEKLISDFPKTVEGYAALSSVAFALGEYQTACDALNTATKLKPDNPELWNQLGKAYIQLNKHEPAQQAFQQALLLDAGNLEAHLNLANTAVSQNNYQEAGRHYLDALNYHPDNVDLWITSGQFARSMNDYETARAAFQRALSLDPAREDAQRALAAL